MRFAFGKRGARKDCPPKIFHIAPSRHAEKSDFLQIVRDDRNGFIDARKRKRRVARDAAVFFSKERIADYLHGVRKVERGEAFARRYRNAERAFGKFFIGETRALVAEHGRDGALCIADIGSFCGEFFGQ